MPHIAGVGDQGMKLTARNSFKGRVVGIREGAVNSQVRADIGGGNGRVAGTRLSEGGDLQEGIKSSEVIVAPTDAQARGWRPIGRFDADQHALPCVWLWRRAIVGSLPVGGCAARPRATGKMKRNEAGEAHV